MRRAVAAKPRRILYIQSSPVPPPHDPGLDRFCHLSEQLEGDVLQPVWFRHPHELEAEFGAGSYPIYTRGRFRYHWFLAWRYHGLRRRFEVFRFYLRTGLTLLRERSFDCIISYSHMATGLIGAALKIRSGVKLIIEVVTDPRLAYLAEGPRPGTRARILHLYSDVCLHVSAGLADSVRLLFPTALAEYRLLKSKPTTAFHEFVPVSRTPRAPDNASSVPFLLLVGAPWYLKGADLLIQAFRGLENDFPDLKLKIMGHFEDKAALQLRVGDAPSIEILSARPNHEALQVIAAASILVLPSRCEGMGRVLLEAMAAGVPVVASDTGGIPFLLGSPACGLKFTTGDAVQLEECLRELLQDPELRRNIAAAGFRRAHQELNEKQYVEQFTNMIEEAVASSQ